MQIINNTNRVKSFMLIFHTPHHTPNSAIISIFRFRLRHKKGVGVCSLPILDTQALALPNSHRIDNAHQPTPARTIYYKVYRNALRRRFGCHLPAVSLRICEIRVSQRQTFENVFPYNKTARLPTAGLTSDGAKIRKSEKSAKQKADFFDFHFRAPVFSTIVRDTKK